MSTFPNMQGLYKWFLPSLTSRIYPNNQVLYAFVHQNAHTLAKKQMPFPLLIPVVVWVRSKEPQTILPSAGLQGVRFPQWQQGICRWTAAITPHHLASPDIIPHHLASRHITWHHPTSSHIIPHFSHSNPHVPTFSHSLPSHPTPSHSTPSKSKGTAGPGSTQWTFLGGWTGNLHHRPGKANPAV